MAGEALGDERRLLGVVRDESRPPQQVIPVHAAEPPGDPLRRHAFADQPERVAHGGAEKHSGQPVPEIHPVEYNL